VKLLDVNVLIYATDTRSAHHSTARPWLLDTLGGSETVGVPLGVSVGFIRLTTSARVMCEPLDPDAAIDVVTNVLSRSNVSVPAPTRRRYALLGEFLGATGTAGNLVSDAHLATLAIEHGAELCSYDTDFARFPGLDWLHPGQQ
jgi:toxin-antitoxin system PIN domain toxin